MSCLCLRWIMIVLLIGSGFAAEVPYVFDENSSNVTGYSSDQIEKISTTCKDLIGVAPLYVLRSNEVAGVSGASKNRGLIDKEVWTINELKGSYNSRVEPNNDFVRHKAKMLAAMYPGDRNIDQICSVYQYMKEGSASEKGWSYTHGPRGMHPPSYPNDTLKVGEANGCSGVGDCNDFAMLMSSLIESLGGTTRIVLAFNRDMKEGHAYAEVYLGNAREDQIADIINYLMKRHGVNKIFTHINSTTKEVWLNLDWSADCPGGPLYKGDTCVDLRIREEFYKTALKLTNDTKKIESDNWNKKGLDLFREENYDEAVKAWTKSIELNPKDAVAWFSIGCALGKQDKNDEALIAYDKAIEINPKLAQAWSNKGYVFRRQGNYDGAFLAYDKAIQLDPRDALTWDNKAYALMDLSMYDQALNAVEAAIEINPKFAKAWNHKGVILNEQGRYNEAIMCYNKAIELDPDEASNWNNKGWAFYLMGKYDESLEFASKAIELNPNIAECWDTKGAAFAGLGMHIEAITYYEKALELDNDHGSTWFHKGNSLLALGRHAEADTAYAIAKDLGYIGP